MSFVFLTWCYDREALIASRGRGLPCQLPKGKEKSNNPTMRWAAGFLAFWVKSPIKWQGD